MNLAKNKNCDIIIQEELERAEITDLVSVNPQAEGLPYVTTYHIDDAAGLLLFVLLVKN